MPIGIHVENKDRTGQVGVIIEANPDECPVCHVSVDPRLIAGAHLPPHVQLVYQCPKQGCRAFFVAYFHLPNGNVYSLIRTAPKTFKKESFEPLIENVSSAFVEIYNQALAAETNNLDQVAGIGFRKALEFLVKDFLIHKKLGGEKEIKELFLGQCIKKLGDAKLQSCADRATWLGNDESHYVRKWLAHDISDLKKLLKLTVAWMHTMLLTEEYEAAMPPP
jgi:hypothetical protein